MKKLFVALVTLLIFNLALAQSSNPRKFAKTITVEDLESRLAVLAADSLEGRDTGTRGQKKAARFIAEHFQQIGISAPVDGSYFQEFNLERKGWGEIYLKKGDSLRYNMQHFAFQSKSEIEDEMEIELFYLGSDTDSSLNDIKGKYVVLENEKWSDSKETISKLNEYGPSGYFITTSQEEMELVYSKFKRYFERTSLTLPEQNTRFEVSNIRSERVVITTSETISWIYGKPSTEIPYGDLSTVLLKADRKVESVVTENVLGYIEGSEIPEEVIVITSHYDHVGMRNGEIYNGADDDGSGTTAVMELAEAFATAVKKGKGPKRSILFMCVSGEEKGLLGSRYYTQYPTYPLDKTVTNLNIDMIGRVDTNHNEEDEYVYVIGSDKLSSELHELSESINQQFVKLDLDYTYNDENDPNRFYYRSDHYNFAKNNVPIIFYFNGTHADYHKPTDTIEKINFPLMKMRTDLIFYTAWEIANREGRIKLD